ncbi:hypothetical protein NP233_g1734 [Leucocoprinus birnbaumii]|uniref:Uncharacterized protein n=1 Tax=Leucocoprinus birnbaumii TaxID=56174 RepID=A0AAD5YXS1_9AGAR|nr:hypothetical protein NP233_g1734 [Leucocoprinus birnbaumii]
MPTPTPIPTPTPTPTPSFLHLSDWWIRGVRNQSTSDDHHKSAFGRVEGRTYVVPSTGTFSREGAVSVAMGLLAAVAGGCSSDVGTRSQRADDDNEVMDQEEAVVEPVAHAEVKQHETGLWRVTPDSIGGNGPLAKDGIFTKWHSLDSFEMFFLPVCLSASTCHALETFSVISGDLELKNATVRYDEHPSIIMKYWSQTPEVYEHLLEYARFGFIGVVKRASGHRPSYGPAWSYRRRHLREQIVDARFQNLWPLSSTGCFEIVPDEKSDIELFREREEQGAAEYGYTAGGAVDQGKGRAVDEGGGAEESGKSENEPESEEDEKEEVEEKEEEEGADDDEEEDGKWQGDDEDDNDEGPADPRYPSGKTRSVPNRSFSWYYAGMTLAGQIDPRPEDVSKSERLTGKRTAAAAPVTRLLKKMRK